MRVFKRTQRSTRLDKHINTRNPGRTVEEDVRDHFQHTFQYSSAQSDDDPPTRIPSTTLLGEGKALATYFTPTVCPRWLHTEAMELLRRLPNPEVYDWTKRSLFQHNFGQAGFRCGFSTLTHALVSHECNLLGFGIKAFIDLRQAYDKVKINRLLRKLRSKGVSPVLDNVIASLFTNTSSQPVVNGALLEPIPHYRRLFQGSLLSPWLFNIYIDDLAERLNGSFPHTGKGIDWENHLTQGTEKALSSIRFLERVGIAWPSWVRLAVYRSFIRPTYEYGAPILYWAIENSLVPQSWRNQLEELHNRSLAWVYKVPSTPGKKAPLLSRPALHLGHGIRDGQIQSTGIPITHPHSQVAPRQPCHPHARSGTTIPVADQRTLPHSAQIQILPAVEGFIFFPDPNVVSWAVRWRLNTFGIGKRCPECRQPFNRAHVLYCGLLSNNMNLSEADFEAKTEEARANRIDGYYTILILS
ncbi:uncharacterized protein VTP21DRAFT_5317 [Calcarisporiella thermophila]|uniref:uncharacterized protein n=1 Tax=Calcarisporiella thermophila TaxID=911321 RepID=UPI003743EE19